MVENVRRPLRRHRLSGLSHRGAVAAALAVLLALVTAGDAQARWPWKRASKAAPVEREVTREGAEPAQLGAPLQRATPDDDEGQGDAEEGSAAPQPAAPWRPGKPVEMSMRRGGSSRVDLRTLPQTPPRPRQRPEMPEPPLRPGIAPGVAAPVEGTAVGAPEGGGPAPPPIAEFDGLDRQNWGAGSPPDTNGDVGPAYYIQTVNTSIGVWEKATNTRVAAFTFDTLMSQGSFGNLCDTENFGDPVVLYDSFEDRWVITDFAFVLNGSNQPVAPAFQCFAVSQTGNPVSGGWNFYSIQVPDLLNDYPKLAIWPDGIYMSANMFGFAGGSFATIRAWAFNKQQMYAGAPTVQVVSFDIGGDFTIVPSNARLQTGTPPPGTPNYFVGTWNFLNALTVYKFHVDWEHISLSTFTGPDVPLAATSWPNAAVGNAAQPGTATLLDVLQIRAMVQNQYTNLAGAESLWVPHTVRRGNTTGFAAPRWYQVNVTGGTVAANLPQAATWDPDAADVINRFMPSLAVDRAGNMALGYSTSSGAAFPSLKYAGRLSTDPANTLSLTEQVLFAGTASQTGSTRWGDYSAMTLDPDGCTFWYTNEYANPDSQDFDKRWKTRIGYFKFDECTTVGGGGTLSGTVTVNPGGAPISGATVSLGSRTTTTNGSGNYSFTGLPAGTYPAVTATAPGYAPQSFISIVVTDAATTTQDFALTAAPASACFTDTTQSEFQAGIPSNVDLTGSPGDVKLASPDQLDQQNATLSTNGLAFTNTTWLGQTFLAAASGQLTKVDLNMFSLSCAAVTMPNVTVSIRNAASNLPTGADLATATITGFCNGAGGWFTATFGSPLAITSGTSYAIVVRAAAAIPAPGVYAWTRSATNTYVNGARSASTDSGANWTPGAAATDLGFKTYVNAGYVASGNLVSSGKDANPATGLGASWATVSWNGTTPAGTEIKLQAAASSSPAGVFNYVGPDGTAGTFFTSGASLGQFTGSRVLRYKAVLTTNTGASTPTLNDVTVCFNNVLAADVSVTKTADVAAVVPGGTVVYTIVVANAGPSAATAASLTDTFPAGCTSVNYTSVAAGGATGNTTSSSGNINDAALNLPVGSSVTYTATCNVAASGTWVLANTATAVTGGGVTEINPGNNSATTSTQVGTGNFSDGFESGTTSAWAERLNASN